MGILSSSRSINHWNKLQSQTISLNLNRGYLMQIDQQFDIENSGRPGCIVKDDWDVLNCNYVGNNQRRGRFRCFAGILSYRQHSIPAYGLRRCNDGNGICAGSQLNRLKFSLQQNAFANASFPWLAEKPLYRCDITFVRRKKTPRHPHVHWLCRLWSSNGQQRLLNAQKALLAAPISICFCQPHSSSALRKTALIFDNFGDRKRSCRERVSVLV